MDLGIGFRELLILLLILAIVGVFLRVLYIGLRSRRNQIKIALDKNVPQYDLEEIEFRELPNGGARVVERSFSHVVKQNSRFAAASAAAAKRAAVAAANSAPGKSARTGLSQNGAAPLSKPAPVKSAQAIPVLMNSVKTSGRAPVVSIAKPQAMDPPVMKDLISSLEDELDAQLDEQLNQPVPEDNWEDDGGAEEDPHEPAEVLEEPVVDDGHAIDDYEVEFIEPHVEIEDAYEVSYDTDEDFDSSSDADSDADSDEESHVESHKETYYESHKETHEDVSDEENAQEFDDDLHDDYGQVFVGDDLTDADILGDDVYDERGGRSEEDQTSEKPRSNGFLQWASAKIAAIGAGASEASEQRRAESAEKQRVKAERREQQANAEAAEQDDDDDVLFDEPVKRDTSVGPAGKYPAQQSLLNLDDDGAPPADMPKPVLPVARSSTVKQATVEQQPARKPEQKPVQKSPAAPAAQPKKAAPQNNNVAPDYNEVMIINIMSRAGYEFAGDDILEVMLANGLRFGEMSIFHRHVDDKGLGPVLFSVANILNPGTFDIDNISETSSRGLCFFLTLPNVIDNMQAFNKMLDIAQRIRTSLDGELKDDNRSVLTAQTIEHYRQRIRDFELRQLRHPHQ